VNVGSISSVSLSGTPDLSARQQLSTTASITLSSGPSPAELDNLRHGHGTHVRPRNAPPLPVNNTRPIKRRKTEEEQDDGNALHAFEHEERGAGPRTSGEQRQRR
jgi:hypothetical protein